MYDALLILLLAHHLRFNGNFGIVVTAELTSEEKGIIVLFS